MKDILQQTSMQGQSEHIQYDTFHHDISNIKPTSGEINHIWTTYLAESMSGTMLKHMVAKAEDPDFKNVLQFALDVSHNNIQSMESIFNSIHYPVPNAFGEKDVDVNAPELFTEAYCVRYTRLMTKYVLINHSEAYSDASRSDLRNLFSGFIDASREVIRKADDVLLAKGLFPKSPYIESPNRVEYVHDKSYYGSFLGSDRPLNAVEISSIFNVMDYKMAMRAWKLGLAQVVKSDKIRDYLKRGLKMADKQLTTLGSLLENEGFPGPQIVDYKVTGSQESPYSDRLILTHVTVAIAYIITAYSFGLTKMARKDIVLTFSRFIAEVMGYVKDGVDILIEHGWLEKIPEAPARKELLQ